MPNTATATLKSTAPDFAALQDAIHNGTMSSAVEATIRAVQPGAVDVADVVAAVRAVQDMTDLGRADLADPDLTKDERYARALAVFSADVVTARLLELLGAGQR